MPLFIREFLHLNHFCVACWRAIIQLKMQGGVTNKACQKRGGGYQIRRRFENAPDLEFHKSIPSSSKTLSWKKHTRHINQMHNPFQVESGCASNQDLLPKARKINGVTTCHTSTAQKLSQMKAGWYACIFYAYTAIYYWVPFFLLSVLPCVTFDARLWEKGKEPEAERSYVEDDLST